MGHAKGKKWKHNLILKAWERCPFSRSHLKLKSLLENDGGGGGAAAAADFDDDDDDEKGAVAPHGCFPVHVGAERERFVVKIKYVNHPLFQMLLEEAEEEHGFDCDGPIWLPCNVDLFYKVLAEMDREEKHSSITVHSTRRSSIAIAKVFSFFVLCRPSRLLCYMNKDHSAYSVMDSELLRLNRFQ
ncbi:unnamed protein product [Sphenostylis stenocarpa]|uniref:Small auxin up regulated protein n=1 Tax=Sphenostylis stenocarpa TaxID=92480 RepID=A0AA86SXY8_9FABA|nr:unnamed protein product [Sphenostylis stenocarpa]